MSNMNGVSLEQLWTAVTPAVKKSAYGVLRCAADANDVASDVCWYLIGLQGVWPWEDMDHAQAYLINKARWLALDSLRRKARCKEYVEQAYATRHPNPGVRLDAERVVSLADKLGPVYGHIARSVMNGDSQTDMTAALGLSKATVSRKFMILKQQCGMDRLQEEQHMNNAEMTVRLVDRYAEVVDNAGAVVAVGTVANNILINLVLKIRGINARLVAELISARLKEWAKERRAAIANGELLKSEGKGKTMKRAKQTNKAEQVVTVVKEKKEPKPVLAKRADIGLASLADIAPTLAKWTESCGGDGYCLDGCGNPVKRSFLPGHDAKLKSNLKRIGNANAKALAKGFGWTTKINWAK